MQELLQHSHRKLHTIVSAPFSRWRIWLLTLDTAPLSKLFFTSSSTPEEPGSTFGRFDGGSSALSDLAPRFTNVEVAAVPPNFCPEWALSFSAHSRT